MGASASFPAPSSAASPRSFDRSPRRIERTKSEIRNPKFECIFRISNFGFRILDLIPILLVLQTAGGYLYRSFLSSNRGRLSLSLLSNCLLADLGRAL